MKYINNTDEEKSRKNHENWILRGKTKVTRIMKN